jgi:hypothetical protein
VDIGAGIGGMINVSGDTFPAKENREQRQFGHLRLLRNEPYQVGIKPRESSTILQREGGALRTVTSESVMPKRQANRKYKDTDTTKEDRPERPSANPDASDYPSIKREFMLTRLADEGLDEAIRVLSRATGTTLSNSHFLRAMLKVVANAMPEIEREASALGKLKRPGNARENQAEREGYELKLARAIASALKSAPPPGLDTGTSQKGRDQGKRPG